ncbi:MULTISPECIES: NAD(P)-dependent alcohol dehydrogenase [Actinoplanes]|uniref:NAD(P)-dependent alcohol dehydrogenase n=1 Tax=Actinoplanes TaxID=1865 RepID=UPI0005F28ABA|nr:MULTISPECIES: NAD(P)-dependent alcohol dehydrogenase [Actinoplanes]GLY02121.1 NADP-dependent alcohol dehydrogenase [Actinoplanes sp. NBRC 101535]
MRTTTAWRSSNGSTTLDRVTVERRDLRDDDIAVRIDYCGVCHSDLHQIHRHAQGSVVPGHEFTGTVTAIGSAVTRFAAGDRVAVGTVVDACLTCAMCTAGQEVYCLGGATYTYAAPDRVDGTITLGGYSREYVVRDAFAYPLPAGLDPAAAAPLMCAGVTVWDPMESAGIGPGSRVAVAGMGGLGHLAIKLAVARGADVTVLSRTPDKTADALALGARDLIDEARRDEVRGGFDLIVDTISAPHDTAALLRLLALDGTLSMLGYFGTLELDVMDLMAGRRRLTSSGTAGRVATASLLDFAARHGITADIELLPSAKAGEALTRLERGDVRYRFVLDLADLD